MPLCRARIHNYEVLPNEFLFATAIVSNANGSFLILSIFLGSIWAIPATLVYTNALRWARNFRIPLIFIIIEALDVATLSEVLYNPRSTRYYLLCTSLINLCCFMIYVYLPLLEDFFNGIIAHKDLHYVRFYLVLKVAWNTGMIPVFTKKEDEYVSRLLLGFIGLVLVADAYILIKQFFLLELMKIRGARRLYLSLENVRVV